MLDYQPEWEDANPNFLIQKGKVQSVKEIIKNKGIIIEEYLPLSTTGLSTVKFKKMRELKLNKTLSLDGNRPHMA